MNSQNTRVLFVSRYYTDGLADNLTAKFAGQVKASKALGFDTSCIMTNEKGVYLNRNGEATLIRRRPTRGSVSPVQKIRDHDAIFTAAKDIVRAGTVYDMVYVRRGPALPSYMSMLKSVASRGGPVVVEIPTHPIAGEVANGSLVRRGLLTLSSKAASRERKYVSGYAVIGENVGDRFNRKPAINIENGIDVDAIPLRSQKGERDSRVHIVALASMCHWHGYDRVLRGIAQMNPETRPILHLVGPDGDGSLRKWNQLSRDLNILPSVHFAGEKRGKELDELINRCDIGLASLGMHRIGLETASTLKVRDYMARGLPFVIATHDPSLPDTSFGFLKVPSDDSDIDVGRLQEFAEQTRAESNLAQRMRTFARANYSWEAPIRSAYALARGSDHEKRTEDSDAPGGIW